MLSYKDMKNDKWKKNMNMLIIKIVLFRVIFDYCYEKHYSIGEGINKHKQFYRRGIAFVMCVMEIIMKTIKTLTKPLLSVMIMITSLSVTALPVKAEPTDGTAYAVLTDNGDLVFFRSYESYTDGIEATVTDINNNQLSGTVFAGIESGKHGWTDDGYKELVKNTYVTINTEIAPSSMSNCCILYGHESSPQPPALLWLRYHIRCHR